MGRTPCCEKEHTNKGAWTKQEDELLIKHIKKHGIGCWRSLPKAAGLLRCGKSCRLRWVNYLRPDLKRGNFTREEDEIIVHLHGLIGSKWSVIAVRMPGRTDNEIKNYWNSHLKKRLIGHGINPRNHNQSSPLDNSCSIKKITETPPAPTVVANDPMSAGECSNSSSVLSEELQGEINLELSIGLPN